MNGFEREISDLEQAQKNLAEAFFKRYPVGSHIQWKFTRWIQDGQVLRHVDRAGDPRIEVKNATSGAVRLLTPFNVAQ